MGRGLRQGTQGSQATTQDRGARCLSNKQYIREHECSRQELRGRGHGRVRETGQVLNTKSKEVH